MVETLKIAIEAATQREEPVDHVLFHGPPGLGKTTLAHIIANEMGARLTVTSGPALEKGGDLIGILTHLEDRDVLFIDEIHRTPKAVEEFLYPAMEDFAVDFVLDKGAHARSHRFRLKRFTLVGATTRVGLLSAPLRDRFGIFRSLEFYGERRIDGDREAFGRPFECADRRGRGPGTVPAIPGNTQNRQSPAQAGARLCPGAWRRTVERRNRPGGPAAGGGRRKGLDPAGSALSENHDRFYKGGPVGIEAIAATLQEEADTLVDVVEPYLLIHRDDYPDLLGAQGL